MDDVVRALAFVAKRQGTRTLAAPAWAHVLSLDLAWMSPSQAKAFVERARAAGLFEETESGLRLLADPAMVSFARSFRPDPDAVPERAAGAAPDFLSWVDRLAGGGGRERVLADVAARQERMGGMLDAMGAVLWIAADQGIDVRDAAKAHEASLGRGRQGQT